MPDSQWLRLALESSQTALELDGDLALSHVARSIVLLQSPKSGDAGPELELVALRSDHTFHQIISKTQIGSTQF